MTEPEPKSTIEQLLAAAQRARSAGDLGTAGRLYQQIVGLDSAHHGALHNLGVISTVTGRLPEAVEWYRRALRAKPDAADTHSNLGAAYKDLGDPARAIEHLSEAIRLQPGHAPAYNNLGSVLMMMNDPEGALVHFRRALELNPDDAVAWCNAGRALLVARGAGAALQPLQRAAALAPHMPEASAALGAALGLLGRYPDAIAQFRRSLELRPGQIEILANLTHMRQHVCDWAGLDEDAARIREYVASSEHCGVSPFFFMMLPGTTAHEQRLCAERFAGRVLGGALARGHRPRFDFSRKPRQRLRIGYLASHFHDHATTRLLVGVLEHHDRARFEIVGLSCDVGSTRAIPGRVRAALDEFVDLRALGDEDAARAIHESGIDILIDAKGYSRGARPAILALRPAPVQAGYLVYPGTLGGDVLDYYIADRHVVPPDCAAAYSERIKYLPNTYQCNDNRRPTLAAPTRDACGLPAAGFVFCSFNQTYKITPDLFDIWCRLLREVPGSVLWVWASSDHAPANLLREARARGIAPERLVFAQTLPAAQHWARIALADLFLDTFPCNAHTTASDALWAGVPLVTCAGETFVSRAACSVLHAAGLPELVATSLADYEALALRLARDPAACSALRARVAANRATSPLFDTARITRDLEAVYEEMWREYIGEQRADAVQ